MLLNKSDYVKSHLNVDDDFKIENENAVYLGPNGIGKTTTYGILKKKYSLYGFFSYEDNRDKVIKEKKKIKIAIRTVEIDDLKSKKRDILNELNIKENGFKKYNISSSQKASEYSELCKKLYNDEEGAVINYSDEKNYVFSAIDNSIDSEFFIQNIGDINNLCIAEDEINNIRNKYVYDALELLENAVDDDDTMCPVCGAVHDKNIIKIYNAKKMEYKCKLKEVVSKYMSIYKKPKTEVENDIKKMIALAKEYSITESEVVNYIIGNDDNYSKKVLKARKCILDINVSINKLENERKKFYDTLIKEWENVCKTLKDAFKDKSGIKIKKNDDDKSIIISTTRDVSTYSTGELNYIVFLINILEFEYSNRENIIIDDPLSSYDLKKQYEIVFDIMFRLTSKGKNVIIFTHNINLINILNSQYPNKFKYYFIDSINNTINLFKIDMKNNSSILDIEILKTYLNDSPFESKWLELLIEKDKWTSSCDRHKLFHYDGVYHDISGYSNDILLNLIDEFENIQKDKFEIMAAKRIIYLCALRVWIEYKLSENFNGKLFDGINGQLAYKIDTYFKEKDKWKKDLGISKEQLMRKKVMLNQNDHYKSQIIPFQYALSIPCDELTNEIKDIKAMFSC